MAGRAKYTEADKSAVYVALTTNDGNIKRTARDTGFHENTIRRWRDEWARSGPPRQEAVEQAVDDFYAEAEEVRGLALSALKQKIPEANVKELITTIGILDDKVARAKGLATHRTEHVHTLPSAEEVKAALSGFIAGSIAAAQQREGEIIDAEIVEQPRGLPSPR